MGTGSSNARILAFKNKVWLQSDAPVVAVLHDVHHSCQEHLSVAATPNRQLWDSTLQAPAPPEGHINQLASLYTQNAGNKPAKKAFRAVPSAPERILDAPDLMDDYYLNLLDWSSTNVVSACIALPISSGIQELLQAVRCRKLYAGLSQKLSLHNLNTPDYAHGCGCTCNCTGRHSAAVQVAIALKGAVYLWNASTGSIETVCPATHACPHAADRAWC